MKNELSNREARRIALAAQGFADRPPAGRVDSRHFDRLFGRVGIVQLDSVNVAVRTHYMPAFSRLGPYPRDRFDRYAYGKGRLFEAWGHEASLLPVEHFPLLRHRMEEVRSRAMHSFARERGDYVEAVYREVAGRGPLAVSDLEDPGGNRNRPWWGRSDGKLALEWLFAAGRLAAIQARELRARIRPGRAGDSAPPAGRARAWGAGRAARAPAPRRPRPRRRYPGRSRRLLPHPHAAGAAPGPGTGGGRGACRGAGRRLEPACLPAPRGADSPAGAGQRPDQPVRFSDLVPGPDRAPVRLPLPYRDLRPGAAEAATATTFSRSCRGRGWRAGSTSRPTGRQVFSSPAAPTWKTGAKPGKWLPGLP